MELFRNEIQEQITYTGDVILGMDEDLTKDNPIKRLIACRPILAFILLHTMLEFEGATQEEVEQSITGSVKVSSVAVDPGLTNTVQLDQQEDHLKGEGAVYYEVRVTVVIPGGKREAKILINLEGQRDVVAGWNDDQPRYDIMRPFIVYVNANGKAEDDDDELIKMLTDLFSNSIGRADSINKITGRESESRFSALQFSTKKRQYTVKFDSAVVPERETDDILKTY